MDSKNTYTGWLEYKGVDFTYVFDGYELRLIPPRDKEFEIMRNWIMTPISSGVYTMGAPLTMDVPYIKGVCYETAGEIVFLTQVGRIICHQNSVLIIDILGYITYKTKISAIDRMSISSAAINCIHPIYEAYTASVDWKNVSKDGVISVTTNNFEDTTTPPQEFIVDDYNVKVFFTVRRSVSYQVDQPPLSLNSAIIFDFAPTENYTQIYRLWCIAKVFIQYLCYRRNISMPVVQLSAPAENGKHINIATLYLLNEPEDDEIDVLKKGRYIKYRYISGCEGQMLSDIAADLIYTRHLPETYQLGNRIDAARFIMIMAAFEWEYSRAYPQGVPKKQSTIDAEEAVAKEIQKLIDSSHGKTRSKYKFLKSLISTDQLQARIAQAGKDNDTIVGEFGNYLYKLNDSKLSYQDMATRLSSQRNHFAHGDMDQRFIPLTIIDLQYLQYLIYAIQLRIYGVSEENVRSAISDLFHCGRTSN